MDQRFFPPIKTVFALRLLSLLVLPQMGQSISVWGQHIYGGKNIKLYEPANYPGGNKNLRIEEDNRGFIYVTNQKGLLEKVYIGTKEGGFHKKTGRFHIPVITPTSIKSSCKWLVHFKVPNTNDTLLLAATQKGTLQFQIQPPFYRTWWVYLLYLIIVSGFITWYLHRSRNMHLHEKNELEKIVQSRTHAISMQKEQLQQQARELQAAMQVQDRLALIASKIDNPVVICALTGQLIWANASFYTIFEGAANLSDKKLWEIPGNGEIEDCFWNCLFDKQANTQQIKNTKVKTDTEYLFQVTLSPVLTPTEEVQQIIGVYSDVTNFHEMNKIRDMLMAVITHDLKSPLLAFKMISETLLIQLHAENHPAVHELNQMCNQASSLYTFTDSLSDWLKNQRGNINFSPQAFELKRVVMEVIQLFRFQSEIKQIEFRNLVSEKLEIWADYNMLTTIFRNLFSNAICHTDKGYIIIQAHKKGRYAIIKVKDNGISAAEQNLFNGEHTGFGLFICEKFVRNNKGKIWQETVTSGTCIAFSLPLANTHKANIYENYNCR